MLFVFLSIVDSNSKKYIIPPTRSFFSVKKCRFDYKYSSNLEEGAFVGRKRKRNSKPTLTSKNQKKIILMRNYKHLNFEEKRPKEYKTLAKKLKTRMAYLKINLTKNVRSLAKISSYGILALGAFITQMKNPASNVSVVTGLFVVSETLLIVQDFLKEWVVRKGIQKLRGKKVQKSYFKDFGFTLMGAGLGVLGICLTAVLPYSGMEGSENLNTMLAWLELASIFSPVAGHMLTSHYLRKEKNRLDKEVSERYLSGILRQMREISGGDKKIDLDEESIKRIFELLIIPDLEKLGITGEISLQKIIGEIEKLNEELKKFDGIGSKGGFGGDEEKNLLKVIGNARGVLEKQKEEVVRRGRGISDRDERIRQQAEKLKAKEAELAGLRKQLEEAEEVKGEETKKLREANDRENKQKNEIERLQKEKKELQRENEDLRRAIKPISKPTPIPDKQSEQKKDNNFYSV